MTGRPAHRPRLHAHPQAPHRYGGARLQECTDLRDIHSMKPYWAEGMMTMHKLRRDAERKLPVLKHAGAVGDVGKACRYFGVRRASFCRWRAAYQQHGVAGLENRGTVRNLVWIGFGAYPFRRPEMTLLLPPFIAQNHVFIGIRAGSAFGSDRGSNGAPVHNAEHGDLRNSGLVLPHAPSIAFHPSPSSVPARGRYSHPTQPRYPLWAMWRNMAA